MCPLQRWRLPKLCSVGDEQDKFQEDGKSSLPHSNRVGKQCAFSICMLGHAGASDVNPPIQPFQLQLSLAGWFRHGSRHHALLRETLLDQ
jgi:hypothetical protein